MDFTNKTTYKLLGIIIALIFLVIFTLQNSKEVDIKILFWSKAMPGALLILISLIIGLFIGWLGIPLMARKKKKETQEIEER